MGGFETHIFQVDSMRLRGGSHVLVEGDKEDHQLLK